MWWKPSGDAGAGHVPIILTQKPVRLYMEKVDGWIDLVLSVRSIYWNVKRGWTVATVSLEGILVEVAIVPAAGATNQMLTPTTEVVGILTVRKIKFEIGKPIMGVVYAALLAM